MSSYKSYKTVGELIDILSKLPRDTKIVTDNDNMEQRGYKIGDCINTEIRNFNVTRRDTYDAFDGTPYSYDYISYAGQNEDISFTGIVI